MSQSELLFVDNANTGLPLQERIALFRPEIKPEHVPAINDRWILASNLQKSIRRGLVPTAEATAVRLLAIDSSYFWRRLLVIAYEDVGYAEISLCHGLLKIFRRAALHRELGPDRVGAYFAHKLACARKSRSLCDAIAMLEFSVRRKEYERQCKTLTDAQLADMACESGMPFMDRIAALRHICGYRIVEGGKYRSGVPANSNLMREVSLRAELTEVETLLFLSGQGVSESLNIPIPMVSQMYGASQQSEQKAEQAFAGKHGVMFAALDRHTRTGKRCLAQLAKEVEEVRQFFERRPALDVVSVLGAVVFIVEGAALDRRLMFDGTDDLLQQFNRNFLEYAGLAPDDQDQILTVAKSQLPRLNRIRADEL